MEARLYLPASRIHPEGAAAKRGLVVQATRPPPLSPAARLQALRGQLFMSREGIDADLHGVRTDALIVMAMSSPIRILSPALRDNTSMANPISFRGTT